MGERGTALLQLLQMWNNTATRIKYLNAFPSKDLEIACAVLPEFYFEEKRCFVFHLIWQELFSVLLSMAPSEQPLSFLSVDHNDLLPREFPSLR